MAEHALLNGWTKYILVGIASAGVSGGGVAALGRDVDPGPSREEIRSMIQADNGYARDQSLISQSMEDTRAALVLLSARISSLEVKFAELNATLQQRRR